MSLFSVLALGFWLGMRHATDADHVVAVSTLVARHKKFGTAWLLGAFWGLGHSLTIFLVGSAVVLLKVEIPERLALAMEFAVALVLCALGLLNMGGFGIGGRAAEVHAHPHGHSDGEHGHDSPAAGGHSHPHVHGPSLGRWKTFLEEVGRFQVLRSLFVGLVHGLAGSAAVALLVLTTIHEPRTALVYLAIFGAGTLAGMLILSAAMEYSMARLARGWNLADRLLSLGTGLLSLLFGLYAAYRIGWHEGLLF
jgi:hypothetical protein